jgi:hypothetical protein
MSMDYTKPLLVPAGFDALGQIGMSTQSVKLSCPISTKCVLVVGKRIVCASTVIIRIHFIRHRSQNYKP